MLSVLREVPHQSTMYIVMEWYIYHFYSLAVEAGFYGDTGRVIGFFTKLGNIHLG